MSNTSILRLFVFLGLLLAVLDTVRGQEKTLTWRWANRPCAEMLSCDNGCSACNYPDEYDPGFFGTNAAWIGLEACPVPIGVQDNAIASSGWGPLPASDRVVLISGILLVPMQLDSIIVRHRSMDDGPTWLRISLKHDLTGESIIVHEGPITGEFDAVSLRDLGCAELTEGMGSGGFQLKLQAYGSNTGAWLLDEVRVVATPCQEDITTGVRLLRDNTESGQGPQFDVLGRPVGELPVSGSYMDATRRVIIR
ncbi:MAG: hypothetical protein KDC00_12555 [Flavobacteriales bacterium]|nr:hypothetical protein [Flavobacteriales bacterium]